MQDAIAANGRMFTLQALNEVWNAVPNHDAAADVRQGLSLAFESGRVRVVGPPAQRWGPNRARVRRPANPVKGTDDRAVWKVPGPRETARNAAATAVGSSVSETALPSSRSSSKGVQPTPSTARASVQQGVTPDSVSQSI